MELFREKWNAPEGRRKNYVVITATPDESDPNKCTYTYTRKFLYKCGPLLDLKVEVVAPSGLTSVSELLNLFENTPEIQKHKLLHL